MGFVPLSMRNVENVDFEVLCLPMTKGQKDPDNRIWLGEVARWVTFTDSKRTLERPRYYAYERARFRWLPLKDSEVFSKSLAELPREIGIFCIPKTEANFGIRLP